MAKLKEKVVTEEGRVILRIEKEEWKVKHFVATFKLEVKKKIN